MKSGRTTRQLGRGKVRSADRFSPGNSGEFRQARRIFMEGLGWLLRGLLVIVQPVEYDFFCPRSTSGGRSLLKVRFLVAPLHKWNSPSVPQMVAPYHLLQTDSYYTLGTFLQTSLERCIGNVLRKHYLFSSRRFPFLITQPTSIQILLIRVK